MDTKRLQVVLSPSESDSLTSMVERTGLSESDVVRAALKLAAETGMDDDAFLFRPLASPDWPWPTWWTSLCERLSGMQARGEAVETATGVRNEIIAVDPHGGYVDLMSERSRSGAPRRITVGMLRDPDNATAHGVIVRVLAAMAAVASDSPPSSGAPGWHGGYRISDLLAGCLDDAQDWPPERLGVYLVSRRAWRGAPTTACEPLYVGSTTGRSARFRTRMGDLLIDMFGFYGDTTGHSSGGQSLWAWCYAQKVGPGDLFIGWYTAEAMCTRCEENRWFKGLSPLLNKKPPPACSGHAA